MNVLNLPIALTLTRLIVSPFFLPFLLVYFLPMNHLWINCVVALIFVAFSLTDFFDGYLARKLGQETALGAILDPIADKFLTYSVLIALAVIHKIYFFWVILLIGREFFMMGLRQIASEHNFSIKVSLFGKLKTIALMVALTFIILNPYQYEGLGLKGCSLVNSFELLLISVALTFSLFSAYHYYSYFIREFKNRCMIIPE